MHGRETGGEQKTYKLNAEKNKTYRLVLEFYQGEGNASVKLRTGKFKKTDFKALICSLPSTKKR